MSRHRRPDRYGTYRRRAWLLGWVALALAGLMLVPDNADGVVAPSADGSQVRISSCVIRLYTSGPQMYDNNGHACLGVTSVRINSAGNLEINRQWSGAIANCSVGIDETLAARGIIAGCSGGLGITVVVFYDTDTGKRVRPDSAAVASTQSNIWPLWVEYVG